MKTLLAFDSPTYLRRLVRELNDRPAGFYYDGERWSKASFSRGAIQITRTRITRHNDGSDTVSVRLSHVEGNLFCDSYGQNICASRRQS